MRSETINVEKGYRYDYPKMSVRKWRVMKRKYKGTRLLKTQCLSSHTSLQDALDEAAKTYLQLSNAKEGYYFTSPRIAEKAARIPGANIKDIIACTQRPN